MSSATTNPSGFIELSLACLVSLATSRGFELEVNPDPRGFAHGGGVETSNELSSDCKPKPKEDRCAQLTEAREGAAATRRAGGRRPARGRPLPRESAPAAAPR